MAFKLENIKIEGMESRESQKIIAEYNFEKDKKLSEDRTFCSCNRDCRVDDPCGPDCYKHCYSMDT
jgi:hypothetical protein